MLGDVAHCMQLFGHDVLLRLVLLLLLAASLASVLHRHVLLRQGRVLRQGLLRGGGPLAGIHCGAGSRRR